MKLLLKYIIKFMSLYLHKVIDIIWSFLIQKETRNRCRINRNGKMKRTFVYKLYSCLNHVFLKDFDLACTLLSVMIFRKVFLWNNTVVLERIRLQFGAWNLIDSPTVTTINANRPRDFLSSQLCDLSSMILFQVVLF